MASQLSVKQCQGPECRALRAALDEAVALLRTLSDRDNYEPYFLAIVDAFLSRLDAGKVTR